MAWPPDRETSQLSFGWERPTNYTLGSGGVTATTIGSLSSAVAASYYEGQMIRVLSGNQKNYIYWVIDNGSYSFTVQGQHTPNESGASIGSGDRIAVSTRGIVPSSLTNYNLYFGLVNAWTPPHKEQTVKNHFSHGSGVTRQKSFVTEINYSGGSIPIIFQGRPEILLAMGRHAVTGTDVAGGGGSTLSAAVAAWDNTITVAAATNYLADDYIQIDVTTNAEVRKISSIDGTTITLDQPLDYSHASGVACNEVEAPWTYTIWPSTTLNRTWSTVEAIDDPEGDQEELIRIWSGCHADGVELASSEDTELTTTISFVSMDDATDEDGTYTKPTVSMTADGTSEDPYYHDDSAVQHNSVDLAIVKGVNLSWRWNLVPHRAHGYNDSKKPVLFTRTFPEFEGSIEYLPVNLYLMDKVDSTERDGYVQFTRGTNDTFRVTWEDTIISTDKWDPPESGVYTGTATLSPEYISFTIVIDDTAPMY